MFGQIVRHTSELDRILALPRRRAEDMPVDLAARLTQLLKTPEGTQHLRSTQALALHDIGTEEGLLGPIGVGEGKTLITLLAPYVLGAKRPLLVLPAGLIKKTNDDWYGTPRKPGGYLKHWRIPNHIRLHSYEMLGRVQAAGFLEEYKPDLLIFDEVHKLKNKRAAVTRRVSRYLADHPEVKVIALSGTIMRRSLLDFGHILKWALKDRAPVPETQNELEEWAAALDEKVNELNRYEPGALLKLCPGGTTLEDARRGFRARLTETPGVVATIGDGERVDCSIYINAVQYEVSAVTDLHYERLRTNWETPDGWELSQPVDVWRHAKELALGLHYAWVDNEMWKSWLAPILRSAASKANDTVRQISSVLEPMIERVRSSETQSSNETMYSNLATALSLATTRQWPENKAESAPSAKKSPNGKTSVVDSASITITERDKSEGFSVSPAIGQLGFSETHSTEYRELLRICLALAKPPDAWRNARRDWSAFVRDVLSRSRTLDSELQVVHACDAGRLDSKALKAWREIKDTFAPNTIAIWHDDSALNECVKWMKTPGLVWTEHDLFARRLAKVSGCKYYGARGLTDLGEFIDNADPKESAIASIDANREGRNLQDKWNRMLITSPPEGADAWQQTLGRLHRPGQTADEVQVDVFLGCSEHARAVTRALAAAQAIKDTTGAESKLLIADVDWPSDDEIASFAGARWR